MDTPWIVHLVPDIEEEDIDYLGTGEKKYLIEPHQKHKYVKAREGEIHLRISEGERTFLKRPSFWNQTRKIYLLE